MCELSFHILSLDDTQQIRREGILQEMPRFFAFRNSCRAVRIRHFSLAKKHAFAVVDFMLQSEKHALCVYLSSRRLGRMPPKSFKTTATDRFELNVCHIGTLNLVPHEETVLPARRIPKCVIKNIFFVKKEDDFFYIFGRNPNSHVGFGCLTDSIGGSLVINDRPIVFIPIVMCNKLLHKK